MDSLTQITLGAAVGEVVLGRKVGNRAMLWGAVGGTIPDLDVVANLLTDQLGALAYHRAISHSFTFALIAPIALGWLVHHLYEGQGRSRWWGQLALTWLCLSAVLIAGGLVLPIDATGAVLTGLCVGLAMVTPAIIAGGREYFRRRPAKATNARRVEWSWLFFWAIFTHPLLDCCTTYGTQVLQPFDDYRAAFNNISVVDPLYTLPFLLCVLITSRLVRNSSRRRLVNRFGIGLSSAYLLLTFFHKARVNDVFEASLRERGVTYERYMTAPTLMNNVLWQGIAETDSTYYYGLYSLFDDDPRVNTFEVIPKNHHLLSPYRDERAVRILTWFSNGYYSLSPLPDGRLQFNDLRFGTIRRSREDDNQNYVFKFILEKQDGRLRAFQEEASRRDLDGAFEYLWERAKGN